MPQTRARGRTLLLALFWALSLASLCAALVPAAAPAPQTGAAWTRTLSASGAWFLAAVALGLGYASLGRMPRPFASPRLWVLAGLFSAVATLGESFAQTGTASAVTDQPALALLYFAGRVPALYLGMALLTAALARPREPQGVADANRAAGRSPRALRAQDGPTPYAESRQGEYVRTAPEGYAAGAQPSAPYPAAGYPVGANAMIANTAMPAGPRPAAYPAYTLPAEPETARRFGLPGWGYLLVLLLCWLPYLLAVWPGTVSNDSITQLGEIFGRKALSNGNPLFQTGLLWLAASAGQGLFHSADAAVALYVCVQATLMAGLLAYALKRLEETRAPAWLSFVATAFYALCPVFPTFAFCVGKDTTFAMAVLWLTLMVWRVVRSKWPPLRTVFGLCLSAVLCALLRNAGAVLAALTLLFLLIYAFTAHTRQWRAPATALLSVAAALLLLYGVALPRLAAEPMPVTENWSAPLQQVARVAAGETLTPEERAAIDPALPVDALKAAYNGELSDPVKALWRDTAGPAEQNAFFAQWLKLGLKYPATYGSALFHNGYGYLLPGYVSTIKPNFLLGMEGRTTLIDGAFDFTVNPAAETLKKTLQSLFAFAPFRLLVSPGAYGWLTLFALAAMMSCRQRRNALCVLPALMVLLGCLMSAVNGYFRYALPLYFAAPALLAMAAQALRTGRRGRDRLRDGASNGPRQTPRPEGRFRA